MAGLKVVTIVRGGVLTDVALIQIKGIVNEKNFKLL